jgi:hypothetical protein
MAKDWKEFTQPYGAGDHNVAELQNTLFPNATTAQLADINDDINVKDKYQGKWVYNTTTDLMVYASDGTAGGTWRASTDGLVDHTPS